MVQGKVPDDIRKYKTKIVGPFSMRQVFCIGIAAAVDAVFFTLVQPVVQVPSELLIYVIMLLDLPILACSVTIGGLPMEKFLLDVVLRYMFTPAKRKLVGTCVNLQKSDDEILSAKEEKLRDRQLKQFLAEHPECTAYK